MRCYISFKDHVTNEEIRSRIQNADGVYDYFLKFYGENTGTEMVWLHLEIFWHGNDNSAGDSERSEKERKERRTDEKITSKNDRT